ncbi:hypothetical protein FIBSPDRAFT_1035684 [Athelia psychrophila]|uniref:DUF6697 domain-containing protein n=1 Tax=Athelia psychrophila TaxID=1759441 RepID=A0A166XEH2_9AGAM|nr:hypothetical protein FIBSPDRAFT_1035684 [Fibularhizoctonia sp. CBS 109695]
MRLRERSESVEIVSYSSGRPSSNSRRAVRKTSGSVGPLNREVTAIEASDKEETDDEADPNDLVLPRSSNTGGDTSLPAFKAETMTELKPTKLEDDSKTSIITGQPILDDKKPKVETKLEPKLEPVRIGITIKSKGEEDEKKAFITLIKGEGEEEPNLFNMDAFGLGPPVVVSDERARTGWTRKEISDAFGGRHQGGTEHHWYSPKRLATRHKADILPHRQPIATFWRDWNPQLPARPGAHGAVMDTLKTFKDGIPIGHQAIPFFVRDGPKDWKLQGCYTLEQCGEISEQDLPRMPPGLVTAYEEGILDKPWGKNWVEVTNNGLAPGVEKIVYTEEGVRAALVDGRLKFVFTIMKCVKYCTKMLDRLEYFRAHPQPSKSSVQRQKRALKEGEQGDLSKQKQTNKPPQRGLLEGGGGGLLPKKQPTNKPPQRGLLEVVEGDLSKKKQKKKPQKRALEEVEQGDLPKQKKKKVRV